MSRTEEEKRAFPDERGGFFFAEGRGSGKGMVCGKGTVCEKGTALRKRAACGKDRVLREGRSSAVKAGLGNKGATVAGSA